MIKKTAAAVVLMLFIFTGISAKAHGEIEIFDVNKEKIIKKLESNPVIEKEVLQYLKEITGIYEKYNPIPEDGFMIRIPIDPPAVVKNKWLNDVLDEAIIVCPENTAPYIMVFDDSNKLLVFRFKGNTSAGTLLNN